MKLIRILLLFAASFTLITISGCKKDSVSSPFDNVTLTENAPTFSNGTNSFAFSINANNFTKINEYILNMNTQTIGVAITVTNFSRGSATLELYSDTNVKVFSRNLSSNTASSETFTFDSRVARTQIHFTNFTATFNCAVTAK
ncbi:MAG: hypothetical protein AB1775_06335 [Bacteroidota bacterium]